jgi:excisionase family DNA binding protein
VASPASAECQLEDLRGAIERLVVKVSELSKLSSSPLALSRRQAARRLGVSRGRTLDLLIQEGVIRTVRIGSRIKIPLAEIERLLQEGAPNSTPPPPMVRRTPAPRATRRPPNVQQELAKARGLKVSDL